MILINFVLGILLMVAGIIVFIYYGEYRRKNQLGGFTFKYITFCFGLVSIGLYIIMAELTKVI